MTDNEIFETEIKCIQRRSNGQCNGGSDCCNCDLLMNEKDIIFAYERAMKQNNFINRQKAEIENLKNILYDAEGVNLVNYWYQQCEIAENGCRNFEEDNKKLQAEIERLSKEVEALNQIIMQPYHEEREKCIKCEKALKSEAIKELSYRLYDAFSQMQREYRKVLDSSGANAMLIAQKVLKSYEKEKVGEQE